MPSRSVLEALVASMTISELSERSGKTVEDIVEWAMAGREGASKAPRATRPPKGRASAPSPKPAAAPKAAPRAANDAVDTRSAAGRRVYEQAVLAVVRDAEDPFSAPAIRSSVGGTPLQVRTALNRLIENGALNYQGRARATRYSAA